MPPKRPLTISRTNAALLALAAVLLVVIVGLKAYRAGEGARPSLPVPYHHRPAADIPEDEADISVELAALREELRGMEGPVDDLLAALDELAASTASASPFTALEYHKGVDRSTTIFVAIPNAMAGNCRQLVNSAFEKASHKFQIRFGLVEDARDEASLPGGNDRDVVFHYASCVDPAHALCNQSKFCPTDYIRIRQVPHEADRGVAWRRHLSTMMFRREEYVLLLDGAAALFDDAWDAKLIADYRARKAALAAVTVGGGAASARVALTGRLPSTSAGPFSPLCFDGMQEGMPSAGLAPAATNGEVPLATSEFLFTEGTPFLVDVPLDRHLKQLPAAAYDVVLSARMHAAGYRFYLPKDTVVFYRGRKSGRETGIGAAFDAAGPKPVLHGEEQSAVPRDAESLQRYAAFANSGPLIRDRRFAISPVQMKAFGRATGLTPSSASEEGGFVMGEKAAARCAK